MIEITLHGSGIAAIGIPVPPETVSDVGQCVIKGGIGEIPSDIEVLIRWPDGSIKAVLAVFEAQGTVYFSPHTQHTLPANLGITSANIRDTWVPAENPEGYDVPLTEPAVYGTLPKEYLQQCQIRTKVSEHPSRVWNRNSIEFGKTSVNDVWETATERLVDFATNFEGWLYDRNAALWNLYIQTGELKWLKHAHRSTQYYSKHLDPHFIKKSWGDAKYSNSLGLMMGYALTGDAGYVQDIKDNYATHSYVRTRLPSFSTTNGLYTERLLATYLNAAVCAYEVTGEQTYKQAADDLVAGYIEDQNQFPEQYNIEPDGWLWHRFEIASEWSTTHKLWASPWMSTILMDSMFRYYQLYGGENVLRFIAKMGDALLRDGFRGEIRNQEQGPERMWQQKMTLCNYGVMGKKNDPLSEHPDIKNAGQYYDNEHSQEAVAALLKAKWCKQQLGEDTSEYDEKLPNIINTAIWTLSGWIRPTPEYPQFRLSPLRKYNWWFGQSADEGWLLEETNTEYIEPNSTWDFSEPVPEPTPEPDPQPEPEPEPEPTPEPIQKLSVTGKGGAYWEVLINGVKVSQHVSEMEAVESSTNQLLEDSSRKAMIIHNAVYEVSLK